jgi:hypothetical protein
MTDDISSARTRRTLARSAYAPIAIGEPVLRTDALATLLLNRLMTLGPMTETAAGDAPATLEAAGAPRSLAA